MKKNTKIAAIAIAAVLTVGTLASATYKHLLGQKEEVLLDMVMGSIDHFHYQPEKINDDFSVRVYDLFLKDIDPNKLFFTKKDIVKFDKYKKLIDDEIQDKTFDFYNTVLAARTERINQAEVIYKEILSKPFDLNKDEEYETDDDKRGYPADAAATKELWHKYLKYQVTQRVADMQEDAERAAEAKAKKDERKDKTEAADDAVTAAAEATTAAPKKPLTLDEMEAEARKKVLKVHDDWFKRLRDLKPDELFSIYLNEITMACDPHTNYMAPEQKKDFDINMSGKLEGIGATLQTKDSYVRVTSLVPGGPAWKTGKLKVDDLIMKVAQAEKDPVDVTDMSINDVIKMIRGKKGTEVRLTVKKTDGSVGVIPIMRDIVELEDGFAKSSIIENEGMPRIGYIDLPRFYSDFDDRNGRHCAKDMAIEVKKLVAENVDGIIIDLRGNGGGSLNDVVEIGGQFIDKGPICQVKSRDARPEHLDDIKGGTLYDGPLLIMVDQYSASASEILAAAMQDYSRAVIIGTKSTFGKGTVQRFLDLDNFIPGAYNDIKPLGSIKMTTQKFYRINGGTTQLTGVIPDIILPDAYSLIDKYGEKSESYPLQWDEIAPAAHKNWEGLSDILPNLKKLSSDRVAANKHFQLINEGAKRLKEQRDRTKYPLALKAFKGTQKELEKASKPLRDSNNEPVSGVTVSSLKVDLPTINLDSSRITRTKEWHKQLRKDVYVHEACSIIADMNRLKGGAIAKKEDKK
jgi:carboxyl-terminal processing protease